MRLIDATRLVQLTLFERDKIPLTIVERYSFGAESPNQHGQSMRGGIRKVLRLIEQAPTIDAVPVIRCKDCIHAVAITNLTVANRCGLGQKNCLRRRGDDGFGFYGVSIVYPDGFCDEGERMDGEAE